MTIYTTTEARSKLFQIVNETNQTHQPIFIKGKKGNAVIMSEEDYEGMQETMYLYSIPGLVERIKEASDSPETEWISDEEFWKDDV